MKFVIHGMDKPGSPLRNRLIEAHRDYLAASEIHVVSAGPLMDDRGAEMIGSLVIVDCDSRDEVDQFLTGEPFNLAGLYETLHVHRWTQRLGGEGGEDK